VTVAGGPVPKGALLLGFSGLIPFWAPALLVWFDLLPLGWLVGVQLAYGAVIASFMGAVHWGLAVARLGEIGGDHPDARDAIRQMAISTVPALLAWIALLMSAGYAQLLLIIVLMGLYCFDQSETRKGLAPAWYLKLRLPLTLLASLSLAVMVARLMIAS